jgi:hypothetical protein
LTDAQSLPYVSRNITKKKGGTMVPEEIIGADTSIQPFLSGTGPEGYMNIQNAFELEMRALALRSAGGWDEPAEWPLSAGLDFDSAGGLLDPLGQDREGLPGLVFGEDDEDDDVDDEEDGFDDMEDDFEDDFEDEDDDFEDEDDDFEDEDEDDDYDYDEDGDFDDDFEE